MAKNVWVFCEQRDGELQSVAIELLGVARELADKVNEKVVALLLGDGVSAKANDLVAYGADEVRVVVSPAFMPFSIIGRISLAILAFEPKYFIVLYYVCQRSHYLHNVARKTPHSFPNVVLWMKIKLFNLIFLANQ